MPVRVPIESGDWFIRRKDRHILRRVTLVSGATCTYREYAIGDGGYQLESSCSESALKRRGDGITEDEVRKLVPDLDLRDRSLNERSREHVERVARLALLAISNEELLAEVRRRGLIP